MTTILKKPVKRKTRLKKKAAKAGVPYARRVVTKYKTYELPANEQGVPVAEYFAGVVLPEPLKGSGAKVYHTADGPVIAMPSAREGSEPKRRPSEFCTAT